MKVGKISKLLCVFISAVLTSPGFAFDEIQQGAGNFADRFMVSQQQLLYNDQLTKIMEEIGNRLLKGAEKIYPEATNSQWTFRIINSPEINAAATAGGFIYIYSGLLDFAESKAEVAWAIAHEMVHSLENHYIEQLKTEDLQKKIAGATIYTLALFGGALLGAYGSYSTASIGPNTSAKMGQLGNLTGGLATGFAATLPAALLVTSIAEGYSQEKELDADSKGWKIVENAGYDPRAIIGLLKRLQYIEEKQAVIKSQHKEEKQPYVSHLLNAKPGIQERIKNFEENLSK